MVNIDEQSIRLNRDQFQFRTQQSPMRLVTLPFENIAENVQKKVRGPDQQIGGGLAFTFTWTFKQVNGAVLQLEAVFIDNKLEFLDIKYNEGDFEADTTLSHVVQTPESGIPENNQLPLAQKIIDRFLEYVGGINWFSVNKIKISGGRARKSPRKSRGKYNSRR